MTSPPVRSALMACGIQAETLKRCFFAIDFMFLEQFWIQSRIKHTHSLPTVSIPRQVAHLLPLVNLPRARDVTQSSWFTFGFRLRLPLHPVQSLSLCPSCRRGNGGPGALCVPHDVTQHCLAGPPFVHALVCSPWRQEPAGPPHQVCEDLQRTEFGHLSPVQLVPELPQPWGRVTVLLVSPSFL